MAHFWLSKSKFIKSLQCQKAIYLNKYHKDLADDITAEQKAIFSQGTNVGELAQLLFPGGTDVTPDDFYNFKPSIAQTVELLSLKDVIIYEAAFEFDGVLCALDILVKENGVIRAFEVKSSTEVKDVYLQDAGLQYFIMKSCGFEPSEISVVHINNQYVRHGELDIHQLFTIKSVKEDVLNFQPEIPALLEKARTTLNSDQIPAIEIGIHCNSPYSCDFIGHCWNNVPEYSVFNISRLNTAKKFDLYKAGILEVKDVPDNFGLNTNQQLQVDCEKNGNTVVNKPELNNFLTGLKSPLFFLDFETFQTAVPLFDNSHPYQQLVFQYSLHIQKAQNEEPSHFEFLAIANGTDPRVKLIDQLIEDTKGEGDILVYNIGFERGRLNELMKDFPDKQSDIQAIVDRLVDLMIPFQQKHYYAPDLQGSYSIKKVLPSLVPDLSYSDLEIQDGGMAMATYKSMMEGTFEGDVGNTRKALLAYCKMDTYAMVKILEKLYLVS
jgi:hypothetical protein